MHAIEQQSLEVQWQKCKGSFNTICAEELARRERVRICLLEAEKEDLEIQVLDDADQIGELELAADELQSALHSAQDEVDALRTDLSARSRDLERLRAELTSLEEVSANSQQLLSEKLALTRELSNLKPELEHLRAQQTSYQELLAEKLELQRQFSSMELELDNERKGNKRVHAQESSRQAREHELQSQLDATKEELAQEARQRQKLEREAAKARNEVEGHNSAQESRIDALRTKLKVAKDELRKTQAQLEEARSSAAAVNTNAAAGNSKGKGRKRDFSEISGELELATPGAVPDKKTKRGSTQIGEKSLFSMTPFLRKTGSVAPDSPPSSPENSQQALVEQDAENAASLSDDEAGEVESTEPAPKPTKPRGRPPKAPKPKPAAEPKKAAPSRKSAKAPELDNLDEEEEHVAEAEEEQDEVRELPKGLPLKPKRQIPDPEDMSFIKKKRKILGGPGKTIFDDDESGPSTAIARGAAKSKGLGALGSVRLTAGGAARGKNALGGFGGFSPLKKDRKATVA